MIDRIIDILDARLAAAIPVDTRWGLCERVKTDKGERPVKYVGGGQARHVVEDSNGNASYWRVTGPIQQQRADIGEACSGIRWDIPMRLVFLLDRSTEVCDGISNAVGDVMIALKGSERQIETAVSAVSASLTAARAESDSMRAAQSELPGFVVPLQRAVVTVDVTVSVEGAESCFESCNVTAYNPCADCGDPGEGCTEMDITVNVNGSFVETVEIDPCLANTLNIVID